MNFCALHDDALTCIFARLPAKLYPILREVCRYFHRIKILDVVVKRKKFFTLCIKNNYAKILEWYMLHLNSKSIKKLQTIIVDYDNVELFEQVHGITEVKNSLFNRALFTSRFRIIDYLCRLCEMNETAWHHAICARDIEVLDYLNMHGYKMPNNLSEYILTTYNVTSDTYLWVQKHTYHREN